MATSPLDVRPERRSSPRAVRLLLAAAVSVLAALPAAAAERIAVLDFTGSGGAEILRAAADRARAAALEPARRVGYSVMTRESTALVLEQMGGACADAQCELEMARTVGAALVVTGEIRRLGTSFLGDLKLHDVEKGTLLAVESYAGKDEVDLLAETATAADRLLSTGLQRFFAKPIPVVKRASRVRRFYLQLGNDANLSRSAPLAPLVEGQKLGVESAFGPRLRFGWWASPSWALEAGAGGSSIVVVGTHLATADGGWLTAGGVWRPDPTGIFSLYAGAGAAYVSYQVRDLAKPQTDAVAAGHEIAPAAEAQVRIDFPIGEAFALGARGGGAALWNSAQKVPAGMANGGREWLKSGTTLLWTVGAALTWAF